MIVSYKSILLTGIVPGLAQMENTDISHFIIKLHYSFVLNWEIV